MFIASDLHFVQHDRAYVFQFEVDADVCAWNSYVNMGRRVSHKRIDSEVHSDIIFMDVNIIDEAVTFDVSSRHSATVLASAKR